jgi:hypothetical protein
VSARHETPEAADASGVTERVPAADPWAYDPTDYHGSRLVWNHEHEAGIPALFAAALAPLESAQSLPAFAYGALQQIAAELAVLDSVQREGDLSQDIIDVFSHGLQERARVAAEVVLRMSGQRRPTKEAK